MDGIENFLGAILGRRVTVLDGQARAEHAGGGASVATGDEQVAAAYAEIQIAGLKFRKFNTKFLCLFLGIHAGRLPRGGAGCNDEFVRSLSARLQLL